MYRMRAILQRKLVFGHNLALQTYIAGADCIKEIAVPRINDVAFCCSVGHLLLQERK